MTQQTEPTADQPWPHVHYPGGILDGAHPGTADGCPDARCRQRATATPDQALRERIEAAARRVPIRLGPNALAMVQRGEPIILNYGEAAELAAALLPLFAEEREAAADVAEDVANELFAHYDTDQGNGAMAAAARLRARATDGGA